MEELCTSLASKEGLPVSFAGLKGEGWAIESEDIESTCTKDISPSEERIRIQAAGARCEPSEPMVPDRRPPSQGAARQWDRGCHNAHSRRPHQLNLASLYQRGGETVPTNTLGSSCVPRSNAATRCARRGSGGAACYAAGLFQGSSASASSTLTSASAASCTARAGGEQTHIHDSDGESDALCVEDTG